MQPRGFYLDAPSGQLANETATLRYDAPGPIGESTSVMGAYEDRVLGSTALQGVVLRYGFFYGPGTWYRPDGASAEPARKGKSTIICNGSGVVALGQGREGGGEGKGW